MSEKMNVKADDYQFLFGKSALPNLFAHTFYFDKETKEATRETNRKVMKVIADLMPNFYGGSADLSSSTNTYLDTYGDFSSDNYMGRNIWFGVREHAMGAILNGMALSNFCVFGSTFLVFSDYLKPAIRLSALMKLPVNYIFSHDSVMVGQDGPTHEPVEQIAMLRSIPNVNVYRPCDAHELIGCWQLMLRSRVSPNILLLSRTEVELLETTSEKETEKGGYIVKRENRNLPLHAIIIATGTEVGTSVHIAKDLEEKGLNIRVVSMPCRELFLKQPEDYKKMILPTGIRTFVVEAGSKYGWESFVYNDQYLITIDQFGISGTKDEVLKYCNFDYETIKQRILNKIG